MKISPGFFKRKKQETLRRKVFNRGQPKDLFLIVCEGEKTEPNYFESFPVPSKQVYIYGAGENTEGVVKRAIAIRLDAKKQGIIFDQTWCVFDRDSFPPENFNKAFILADKEKIKIAYSNEAFELWYLLHFNYIDTALHRTDYIKKLDKNLNKKYEKNSDTIYDELLHKQNIAIRNAKKLLQAYEPFDPLKNNPSTTAYLLVEELNKFLVK